MKIKAGLLFALLAVVTGTAHISAQNNTQVEDGPEEAGKEFVAYLARQDIESLRHIVAQDSSRKLGDAGVEALLRALRLIPSRWETRTGESGEVLITPIFEAQPVVCRKEGRFWRVDAIATAVRWMKFDAADGARKIIRDYSSLPQLGPESRATCTANLQAIAAALKQYQEDNNGAFPPAERWVDSLSPYARDTKIFHCPAAGRQNFGYAMNENLAQQKRAEVAARTTQVPVAIIYEASRLERNTVGAGQDFVHRHEKTGHALLTDGSVRSIFQGVRPQFQLPSTTQTTAPQKPKK
jgi:hypothetical protein